jgi:hypothetical protein
LNALGIDLGFMLLHVAWPRILGSVKNNMTALVRQNVELSQRDAVRREDLARAGERQAAQALECIVSRHASLCLDGLGNGQIALARSDPCRIQGRALVALRDERS